MKPGHRSSRSDCILVDTPPSISTTKRTQYAKVRHAMNSVIAALNRAESTSFNSASALWRDRAPRAISASRRRGVIFIYCLFSWGEMPIRYTKTGAATKRNWPSFDASTSASVGLESMDHRQVTDLVCGRPVVETLARELREAGGGSFLNPGMLERRRLNLFPLRLLGSFCKTAQPNFAKS